ncbi:MAG: hypothetical protein K0V04_28655, partial [Deltaproteobacteria bacterium]|nr:hypothetical protein [Deltaproteobacteria bacterium]
MNVSIPTVSGLRRAAVLICALASALPASGADAAEPSSQVAASDAQLRQAASDSFAKGDYAAAIRGFETAYERSAEPTDLYNLGRIHEEMGELSEALAYYESFVEQPHVALDERRLAADRIEVLRVLVKPEPDEAEPTPQNRVDPTVDDPRPVMRPMVITGGALLGVGVAVAAAGGIAFGIRGQRASEEIDGLA